MTTPKKDVIYIDIEDDITSVIEKVKNASSSIVALVPPKRTGVLQSIVNLKLLNKAATGAKKRLVLITNDHALSGLAAGLSIPVAKNLQSKPEIPTITAMKLDDDEVINGEELPVGEFAGMKNDDEVIAPDSAIAALENFDKNEKPIGSRAPKKSIAIPDFDSFRKKMLLLGGFGIVLVGFLVWAIFFAGHATVSITAKTNVVNISKTLQLRPNVGLDANQAIAQAIVKEVKKTSTVDFAATGKKDVGEKSTGEVAFINSQEEETVNIPAGTEVLASGLTFVTNTDITIEEPDFGPTSECGSDHLCEKSATVRVTAAESGSKYNTASGAVSGSFDGATGSFVAPTSGGTDKTVTVVSQADIDKAKEKLKAHNADQTKAELVKKFDDTQVVIQESYKVTPADPTSNPGVDQEATTGKLTAETTFRLVGMKRSDLRSAYDTYTKSQIAGQKNQKIYTSGDEKTRFSQFSEVEGGFSVKADATAQVGPNIDENALAKQVQGMRAGEIQQLVEAIPGVEDVTTKFSPFWVTKAPNDVKKIDIKFVIKNS